jgi:hypothetical protein
MLHDLCGGSEEVNRTHRFHDELVFAHDGKNLFCYNSLLIISRWKGVKAFEDPRNRFLESRSDEL